MLDELENIDKMLEQFSDWKKDLPRTGAGQRPNTNTKRKVSHQSHGLVFGA